jgi:flagellar assembly factor FliW
VASLTDDLVPADLHLTLQQELAERLASEPGSKAYGAIEVDERQRIVFPFGILGFESLKEYVLLDAEQRPFYWLQSAEAAEIAFVLINPRIFRPDYTLEVSPDDLAEIGIGSPGEAPDFAIVTIPEDPKEMTANLQGPIIINRESRVGRQSISSNAKWQVRHPLLKELALVKEK